MKPAVTQNTLLKILSVFKSCRTEEQRRICIAWALRLPVNESDRVLLVSTFENLERWKAVQC